MRPFAPPPLPWLAGHRGVDLDARPRRPVHAAGAGVVVYAGPFAARGVVSIAHADGLRTTYLPVRTTVRRGQTVRRGDIIGVVEKPRHTDAAAHCPATCLHWGLIGPDGYLDPLLLLARGQVRLLPRWPPT
ncbi:M23 family metallopeptidase [Sphaerisporangium sp. TRM90804]|uniref:M23 family metallopeptidase n=1 Tax=Sphaerisporangium sp. TRM90804 TaxID=3031113 RepID=UPI00244888F5|nr:M23 family metallopeptidase [Sphaerisporangium sp. TRM90804]MDH2430104.1 M23 family metallopeptidase [Sphaerisporangium sp. TRM90804]